MIRNFSQTSTARSNNSYSTSNFARDAQTPDAFLSQKISYSSSYGKRVISSYSDYPRNFIATGKISFSSLFSTKKPIQFNLLFDNFFLNAPVPATSYKILKIVVPIPDVPPIFILLTGNQNNYQTKAQILSFTTVQTLLNTSVLVGVGLTSVKNKEAISTVQIR